MWNGVRLEHNSVPAKKNGRAEATAPRSSYQVTLSLGQSGRGRAGWPKRGLRDAVCAVANEWGTMKDSAPNLVDTYHVCALAVVGDRFAETALPWGRPEQRRNGRTGPHRRVSVLSVVRECRRGGAGQGRGRALQPARVIMRAQRAVGGPGGGRVAWVAWVEIGALGFCQLRRMIHAAWFW